jgi:polyvinyl alcohol dehydrogenase (cytochrome)
VTVTGLALACVATTAARAAVTVPAAAAAHAADRQAAQRDWPSAGQNNDNTHNAAGERIINVRNVGELAPKWTFTTAGDVSATATVADGRVYVPDWGGKLWAINAATGNAVWSRTISSYDGIPGDASRTSPAYWHGELVIGTGAMALPSLQGANVVGIDARTGAMLWRTEVDSNPAAIVTSSPTVDRGVVYVGTSSREEELPGTPTFQGSVLALSARTGKILWRTYTVPAGYTGGAMWGSQPVVDHQTGMLYVGVGNNYTSPPGVCLSPTQANCTPRSPDDHIDSVLALSLKTGTIEWSHDTLSADTWTIAMPNDSPDYDFGAGPNLFTTTIDGHPAQILGIGQKSGVYHALNPANGKVIWQAQAGPGGGLGGIEWGTAADGRHVYFDDANYNRAPYTITSYDGTKTTITSGLFGALDAATGKIAWQVADPQGKYVDISFVSSANGIMFAGSAAPSGPNMYAFDGTTGELLWSFASGGAEWAGAAIAGGAVYWGSGYRTSQLHALGYPGDNDKLYAFTLRGR